MYAQHHRFAIYNYNQHPYVHDASELAYANGSAPGVTNLKGALDTVYAVLYPQSKPAVANQAALPPAGNTVNDFRVVTDDGDGKAAGYRWEQREGEAAASWHKIADVDWGSDSILQEWEARTQDSFVMRWGYDGIDASGAVVAGVLAGQQIFGGKTAGSNLTLWPNSGDGAGAVSGYVQFAGNVRPTLDNVVTLGEAAHRFTAVYALSAVHGTLTLGAGSISDSSGTIGFGATHLETTGHVYAGTLRLSAGSIVDTSGTISFGATVLATTGAVSADHFLATAAASSFKSGTTVGHLTLADGSITDSSAAISFGACALTTSSSVAGGTGVFTTSVQAGNLKLLGNVLSSVNANGAITLTPNGAGHVVVSSILDCGVWSVNPATGVTITAGTLTVTGAGAAADVGNLHLAGDTLSTTDLNGDLILAPNGSGYVKTSSLYPSADAAKDLGKTAVRYQNLYLSGSLGDGTNVVSLATLLSLRGILAGVSPGNSIFWNGTQWVAADPDSEVFHHLLSDLTSGGTDGDSGHSQFVVAAGRAAAQTIKGGTAASANLTLDSTNHATKGQIKVNSTVAPVTDASLNIGDATHRFVNLYLSGQGIGFCAENAANVAGLPAASAGTKGRLAFETALNDLYVDTGGTWKKVGVDPFMFSDTTGWTGAATTITYDVSARFADARLAIWTLQDNSNNRKQILADIDFPSATQVRVTVGIALAAGTYTLIGVG